jgi:hypothetical protein
MFATRQSHQTKISIQFNTPVIWLFFFLYMVVLIFNFLHHQPWGDELHSWNIAKGSTSFFNLVYNTRYEGHPPLWYIMLWCISKCSHNILYMQLLQAVIAILVVLIILFYAPFNITTKLLIPFGYFFIFEYGIFSRNYAIGVLLCLLICTIVNREFKYKTAIYYLLLFLLSNVHLLSLFLAVVLHLYFILGIGQNKQLKRMALHMAIGCLVLLPSVYFIIPSAESELSVGFMVNLLQKDRASRIIQLPLRAFVPIPEWWHLNFWNTQFLLEIGKRYIMLKFLYPIVSFTLTVAAFFVLTKDKKALLLFGLNLFFSVVVTFAFFPLNTERYCGFIFIAFLVCLWLYDYKKDIGVSKRKIINVLLCLQIVGSLVVTIQSARAPFSNSYRVGELLSKVPAGETVVTDYWALNTIAAYTDKPFYCVDLQKPASFILWGPDMKEIYGYPTRLCRGSSNLMRKNNIRHFYMVSTASLKILPTVDAKFLTSFHVELIDKIDGAIEPGSNVYLYKISEL